jgi:hypothetical protein
MPRLLEFFKRQVVAGSQAATVTIYSEIYEVAEIAEIAVELNVYGANPTNANITGSIDNTSDYTFSPGSWQALAPIAQAGVGVAKVVAPSPLRYVRASLTIPAGAIATVSLMGIGREVA